MIRSLSCAILFVIACGAAPARTTTTPTPRAITIRYGIVDDSVRAMLTRDWDAHENDHPILERAYCLRWRYTWWGQEIVYQVTGAVPSPVSEPTPSSVRPVCPAGPDVAELHTHPPQTCQALSGSCARGGIFAWQCMPSDADYTRLQAVRELFAALQCDRNAIVFYLRPAWP